MKSICNKLISVFSLALVVIVAACSSDDINDDSYYTFSGETVASYCENNPEFSIFSKIIKESGEESLLSTYGHYTSFIPTDSAFEAYFRENKTSYEALTDSDKRAIVFNHIIRSVSTNYMTKDFSEGALPAADMNDRYIVISYLNNGGNEKNSIMVNKNAEIIKPDQEVHNGVIHVINKVLVPSDETLGSILKTMPKYSIFSDAFDRTHLNDSIAETYDMSYKNPYNTEYVDILGYTMKPLTKRRLGYTIFAEPDSVFRLAGINSFDDLVSYAEKYYGTEDRGNYTSRNNAVNKFISYHMLNRQLSTNTFVYSGPTTSSYYMNKRYEYYETMLKNRLMEIKANYKINSQRNGDSVTVNVPESNISGMNGYIHSLNKVLVYDEDVMTKDVLNKRIRFDAYSIPPQLTNSNIRWNMTDLQGFGGYTMSPDFCGDYLKFNDASKFIMWASNYWGDYQGDEMSVRGWYDVTVRMLPVPPGTYEIRLGYSARSWGGIAQVFVDNQIIGIPVSFNYTGDMPQIGWVADDQTEDNGVENDKMMRNRGYMKGPQSVTPSGSNNTLRNSNGCLRFILGTFTFQNYGPHYFRAKNVESENGEFHFDYIEYVPINIIENEDRD